jgi:hypothetical protein
LQRSEYCYLHIHESTDGCNSADLLKFMRYCFNDIINDYFEFLQLLQAHNSGQTTFNNLYEFIIVNQTGWSKCVGVSADGGRAMSWKEEGLITFIPANIPCVELPHCCMKNQRKQETGYKY